jgi:hypothetical protein
MEAPELERRLTAILAADVEATMATLLPVEGYSRLMHGDEDNAPSDPGVVERTI